jgi:plastocyanin
MMAHEAFMRILTAFAIFVSAVLLATVVRAAMPTLGTGGTTVRIRDMHFQPSTVTIKVGQSVTWTNADDRDHTVNAVDNSFKSGNLKNGASFTHRFEQAGSFDYACSYHPRMRGTVSVEN